MKKINKEASFLALFVMPAKKPRHDEFGVKTR